jgi:hypothetical protein
VRAWSREYHGLSVALVALADEPPSAHRISEISAERFCDMTMAESTCLFFVVVEGLSTSMVVLIAALAIIRRELI